MHNHSYENEFNLHVNEISFSYERMSTKTRFEKEANGNSEMAYCFSIIAQVITEIPKQRSDRKTLNSICHCHSPMNNYELRSHRSIHHMVKKASVFCMFENVLPL